MGRADTGNRITCLRILFACFIFPLLCVYCMPSSADDYLSPCEAEIAEVGNWDELFEWYRKYPHCDDGYLGEWISDMVTEWLALDWKDIERLSVLSRSNAEFKSFVLKNIEGKLCFGVMPLA